MSKAVEKKEFIDGIDILEHEQLQSDIVGLGYLLFSFIDTLHHSVPNRDQISAVNLIIDDILTKISKNLDDLVTKD
ncbi:hypothetical protein Q4Y15_001070 [Campylobacter fetus]|uniref:Uncharacterized protein n=3 Tax=Campylobacter fetus TaxID=196 RepID=A0AAE6MB89_CAMFE|nr:hypothetical protein [Campylobacter fetus]OCS21643.1 hypothetical protein CFVI97532_08580 [Campylobacter fetus subsp. venerealis cfvi97/532]OCS26602.1 hypothetical protein CFVB10_03305 [Campylobacter fetus subsp. venerealis cfvB10]OCS29254.1 hypothetical protein CFVCCUG33900_07125 [Campylobacter fetus subsp. venerealis LMG 6570 = CCUG 33900]OCS41458.1 hypothetical protein CFVI02298_06835 [Campylobacter fetus subsp. venerealis cfvi02/298]ABK81843.1 hypothetical protein CFF8240_1712 [Campylob